MRSIGPPADPTIVSGTLKNGLRYAIKYKSELFSDYGMVGVDVEIAPEKEAFLYDNVAEIMRDLARTPLSTGELGRAVAPMLSSAKATLLVTNYWLGVLVGADENPRLFDTIRTHVPDIANVRPADIQRLARDYLSDKPSLLFVVRQCPRLLRAHARLFETGPLEHFRTTLIHEPT